MLRTQQHTVAIIKLIVHSVMNTAAHSGSNTAYSAQCYEHSNTFAVIQCKVHRVMTTTTQSGSNTA